MKVKRASKRVDPLKVATDGEICWMKPPLNFRVDPQPLMLMVPATVAGAEPKTGRV
jgi:hypothetical protein